MPEVLRTVFCSVRNFGQLGLLERLRRLGLLGWLEVLEPLRRFGALGCLGNFGNFGYQTMAGCSVTAVTGCHHAVDFAIVGCVPDGETLCCAVGSFLEPDRTGFNF